MKPKPHEVTITRLARNDYKDYLICDLERKLDTPGSYYQMIMELVSSDFGVAEDYADTKFKEEQNNKYKVEANKILRDFKACFVTDKEAKGIIIDAARHIADDITRWKGSEAYRSAINDFIVLQDQ